MWGTYCTLQETLKKTQRIKFCSDEPNQSTPTNTKSHNRSQFQSHTAIQMKHLESVTGDRVNPSYNICTISTAVFTGKQ